MIDVYTNIKSPHVTLELDRLDDIRCHVSFTRVWKLNEDGSKGEELTRYRLDPINKVDCTRVIVEVTNLDSNK